MRKILLVLLALLLCGCGREVAVATAPVPSDAAITDVSEVPEVSELTEATEETQSEPEDHDFVRVLDYIPTARQELPYATQENFTGKVIYGFQDAWLRYGTVKKLMAVSADLEQMGIYLKIWDGFRPISAQFTLWEACPDATYVANPNVGYSSHSRGNTVDLTIVDANGAEFPMPTDFDDFSAKADRDYADCSEETRNNAMILEIIMEKHGFTGYAGEWWHYSDTAGYPVETEFEPT